jgi:hypothetical protein
MPPQSGLPTASTNNSRQRTTTDAIVLAIGEDGRSTIESGSQTYKLKLPSSKYYRSDRISCVRRPATSYDATAERCATLCRLHRRPLQSTRRRRHQPSIIAVACTSANTAAASATSTKRSSARWHHAFRSCGQAPRQAELMRLKKGDVTVTLRYAKSRDMIWLRPYRTARWGMRSGSYRERHVGRDAWSEVLDCFLSY